MAPRLYRVKHTLTAFYPSRDMEWQNAGAAFVFAIILLTNPVFLTGSQWDRFSDMMTEKEWGLTILAVALVRIAALLVNGHWQRTPALRAATALLGAGLWGMVALMFVNPPEPLTTGVGVYAVLAIGDLRCAWKAAKEAAIADWLWGTAMRESPPAPLVWATDPGRLVARAMRREGRDQ